MNQLFNPARFGRLFVKHTVEHYKGYLMSLAVLMGVMVLGGSFLVYMMEVPIDIGFQTAVFTMILILAGTIFTSTIFSDFADKKRAVTSLTLPATHFEKFMVAWIYSFLLFIVIYTLAFYLVVTFAINVKHYPGHPAEMINVLAGPIWQMYLFYAFLHSVAFFGAIFFEKLHFIKTAFLFFIFIAIVILFNKVILGMFIGNTVEATVPFVDLRVINTTRVMEVHVTRQPELIFLWLTGILAFCFWIATYYRLKEKQV